MKPFAHTTQHPSRLLSTLALSAIVSFGTLPASALEIGETVDVALDQMTSSSSQDKGEQAVTEITFHVMALVEALNGLNIEKANYLYSGEYKDAVFFSAALNTPSRGPNKFVKDQKKALTHIEKLFVHPEDMQVQYLGDTAIASLTGHNTFKAKFLKETDHSAWRWTLVFHNQNATGWTVAHEHFSSRHVEENGKANYDGHNH